MLRPEAIAGLTAEDATQVVGELQRLQSTLDSLRNELRRLADGGGSEFFNEEFPGPESMFDPDAVNRELRRRE
jgi:hypothetical protein